METLALILLGVGLGPVNDNDLHETAAPALLRMVDVDGDGLLDRLRLEAGGALGVALNRGGRQFEPIAQDLPAVALTDLLVRDLDGDGHVDLYLVSPGANVALLGDGTGRFVDGTLALGLSDARRGLGVERIDIDADGTPDLLLHNVDGDVIFWGSAQGVFERDPSTPAKVVHQGRTFVPAGPITAGEPSPAAADPRPETGVGATGRGRSARGLRTTDPARAGSTGGSRTPLPTASVPQPLLALPTCAKTIADLSTGDCVAVDSTPTFGRLYPLGPEFFISAAGNVGIGTTTPGARLEVDGTALVTDTLTLAPTGDQALDVSTGSIYKQGALFIHTRGTRTTAVGEDALAGVTSGVRNTASGYRALTANTTGNRNTGVGDRALYANTTGSYNTASGHAALLKNTTGYSNTAIGTGTLFSNTTGSSNTATGHSALALNTTGALNTASGYRALRSNTIGIGNTASGSYALGSNVTGGYNTASGFLALYSNTGGDANVASGAYALFGNTTGSNNTAAGQVALANNTTGYRNTAVGASALYTNTIGYGNTAVGVVALNSNTDGIRNTALGDSTLFANTTGYGNTALGMVALANNTTGLYNTALGDSASFYNTTGNTNTAIGFRSLALNTTGGYNIALGWLSGYNRTTGSDNIDIGHPGIAGESTTIRIGTGQTATFMAGIRGVTTVNDDAIPVLVDSAGQLGTVSSSRRFKEEIRDMGATTDRLLELRPVVFRYKPEVQPAGKNGERALQYGLIAEEVAEVFPELVVLDEQGLPFTVKYHLLSAMLLNELQKLRQEHARDMAELRNELDGLEAEPVSGRRPVALPVEATAAATAPGAQPTGSAVPETSAPAQTGSRPGSTSRRSLASLSMGARTRATARTTAASPGGD